MSNSNLILMFMIKKLLKYIGLFTLIPVSIYNIMCKYVEYLSFWNLKDVFVEYEYIYWYWIPVDWKIVTIEMLGTFNYPIKLPKTLLRLFMGNYFNQPIVLPNSLKHLTMGEIFNQPIILPETLEYLSMGDCFNQHIVLPNRLIHLKLGSNFDKMIRLPNTLRYLVIRCHSKHKLLLPESLEAIAFGYSVSTDLVMWYCENLPNSVSTVVIRDKIGYYTLANLPNSVKYLIEFMHYISIFNNANVKITPALSEREKLKNIVDCFLPNYLFAHE